MKTTKLNSNSEVTMAPRAAAWGAHAAGVLFSAARRKLRSTNFFARWRKLELGHEELGGPPNSARGPRALPAADSEFGFNSAWGVALNFIVQAIAALAESERRVVGAAEADAGGIVGGKKSVGLKVERGDAGARGGRGGCGRG